MSTSRTPAVTARASRLRTWFQTIAIAEALSWTGLLIGMAFKYVLSDNEIGVQIFGPIHGAMFLTYVVTVLLVRKHFGWSPRVTLLALAAAFPPLFTWWFEHGADRRGLLSSR